MPMQSAASSQSVEEILASIRQAIAEDEARRGRGVKSLGTSAAAARTAPTGRGFSSANDDDDWDITPETDLETQNDIDLAIETAIGGVSASLSEAAGNDPSPVATPLAGPAAEPLRAEPRAPSAPARPLLSARTGAAVAASFEDLARNVASLSAAEVTAMAQEMLRPMLKSWLDDNLPSLVERLVRDEIERVSRGR
jgi:cell pole-organizing protein PopZ